MALATLPDVPTASRLLRRPLPGWLLAALAAVAVLAVVAALGGFQRRQVAAVSVEPGTEIDARNLVFSFDSATAQYLTEATDQPWRVVVSGSVRNPHDETLYPMSGDYGNLVGIDPKASPVATGAWQPRLGPADPEASFNNRQMVPPDNQPMTLEAVFRFDEFTPGDSFEVRVVPMEYTANLVLGLSDRPHWNVDSFALPTAVVVPLTQLPDGDY